MTIGDPAKWEYNGLLFKHLPNRGPDQVPTEFAGRRRGRTPTTQERDVVIELTANAKGVGGTVTYPGQGCTGRLGVFLYVEAKAKLLLYEDFGAQQRRCPFNGQFDITRVNDGGLSFRCSSNESIKKDVPLTKA